ncbi:hypothetical protein SADUNF_Sadunf19G0074100 [Salix dunnii]|uniref:AP2/ERF domain-containing protein n=1 Tax=Salix dunnii TaxID=1413687 RepID=A0A835MFC9_9ROSI|nr:hypothetical protein SADUNF_Sadunf19G0074100 [Salix dunnii]
MSINHEPPGLKTNLHASEPASKRSSKKRIRQPDAPFHGVRKRSWGRYVSEIRLPGKKTRVWLGSFGSPEMAARAHDSAAFFLRGNSASLNFPDSVGSLPRPESCSSKDIQLAAAKAAIGFENARAGNRVGIEDSESGGEPESSIWLGLGEIETVSYEEVKRTPLFCPLRFDSVSGNDEMLYMNDQGAFIC